MEKIWIDTDLGADCDDAGALAIANVLHNLGKCKILGMTHTTTAKYAGAGIEVINNYYKNIFEIGVNKRDLHYFDDKKYDAFLSQMAKKFALSPKPKEEYEEALILLRKLLAKEENITLICIGQLNNLAALINSKPDDISPLAGLELMQKALKKIVVMGGYFDNNISLADLSAEYNIVSDIDASKKICLIKNIPVYFCDFKLGSNVFTGGNIVEEYELNPVAFAYKKYANGNRPSWDLLTVYYAIYGDNEVLNKSKAGFVDITDDGKTLFHEDKLGNCYIIKSIVSEKILEKTLNKLLEVKE